MKRAIKPPTKAEQEYQDAARALGCVVCLWRIKHGMQRDILCGPTHMHHRNVGDKHGQKQIGQHAVVALGAWHHDGVLWQGWSTDAMREFFGPSFAAQARDFRAWTADALPGKGIGTEAWQAYQNELLAAHGIAPP